MGVYRVASVLGSLSVEPPGIVLMNEENHVPPQYHSKPPVMASPEEALLGDMVSQRPTATPDASQSPATRVSPKEGGGLIPRGELV